MTEKTKILHVEDHRSDADLVKRAMSHETNIDWLWVWNRVDFVKALNEFRPDIILCDHSLPGFDSSQAFKIVKEKHLKIPFILITGTISEEFAVMMMKEGISDYLLKDRIQRLPAAISQALEKHRAEKEREMHLEEIVRNEANLKAIIENSDAHIYSLDKDFRYITFNSFLQKTLKESYGLEIQEGDVIYDFLNKLDPSEAIDWEKRYQRAFSGESLHFVKEFRINSVHTFTSFSINPIREGDKITGLSCFAFDITPQKLAEEKMKQSEARFRALIENNYDAILLRDENLNIIYRSPSANKMIGYDEHEVLNSAIYNTIHTDDAQALRERLELVMQNPGKPFRMTVRARHKDGHYIWVEGSIRNMLANENVKGIIFNYRDISERKELELQREKMIGDITQRIKGLEQFTYIVSHNLRAPVANILGLTSLLEYDGLDEHQKDEALAGISSSAKKLDGVIIDLNTILQMKQEQTENKQLVLFQVLIDDIYVSISERMKNEQVNIITDFTKAEGVKTIKSYLYSIFFNLIFNSLKYKRPDIPCVIEVRSFTFNQRIGLVFKDNGLGINLPVHANEVFGLYKRFHLETEGKGMGLYMVKAQVEAIGGTIEIKSEINNGTEFTIML